MKFDEIAFILIMFPSSLSSTRLKRSRWERGSCCQSQSILKATTYFIRVGEHNLMSLHSIEVFLPYFSFIREPCCFVAEGHFFLPWMGSVASTLVCLRGSKKQYQSCHRGTPRSGEACIQVLFFFIWECPLHKKSHRRRSLLRQQPNFPPFF
jgi:hypothetical protein